MPKKVFELANEIGIGAIDLVEKLKGLGLNVRNHMVTLQDDEIEKAMAAFSAPTVAETKKKKVVKKKVTKKKVTKKKVIKKVTATTGATEETEATEEAPIEEVTEKPAIVAKDKSEEAIEEAIEEVKTEVEEVVKEKVLSKSKLEVVSHAEPEPEKKKTVVVKKKATLEKEAEEKKAEKLAEKEAKEKGIYKEKMHKFTPIFVPEPKKAEPKKDEKKTTTEAAKPRTPGYNAAQNAVATGNKRIGDLAAAVSKKSGATKSESLTQMRGTEELKLAGAVMGRQLYTPMKRKKIFMGATKQTTITELKESKRVVDVYGVITAGELSQKLSQKFGALKDQALTINLLLKEDDYIGVKLATEISDLFDYKVVDKAFDENKLIQAKVVEDKSHLPLRNPIITVMGHVDHGKTTLLDQIRKTKVTDGEAGGITQHIGAYSVLVGDSTISFLDTPGHAAFGAMRQRGANLTDIVVLVVAADDGVMPQTKESIKYARNAGSPIIVAINKMDKEGANPERIKQELTEFELVSEDWGGDTMFVPISALNNEGIVELLEAIKLQAEILELREDPKGKATGIVIESRVESGRGPVATVLVQKGTLKKGDAVVAGECYGRARSLMNDAGTMLNDAGPSIPVQILGFATPPSPGETVNIVKSEREAKKIVENRIAERKKLASSEKPQVASLEDFFAATEETADKKILNLIIRSDVQGSYEAIVEALEALGNDEVGVNVLSGGVGAITDNDVQLATSSNGYLIGFNMRPVTSARKLAEQNGVEVRTYSIIYKLIDEITMALEGMLDPEKIEKYIGRAEVRDTFSIPKIGTVAGSAVIDGKIERGCNIRVLREGKILHDGKLSTLKRFKDEVKEVSNGYECGMALEGFDDIKVNDIIEAYLLEEKKRTLDSETVSNS